MKKLPKATNVISQLVDANRTYKQAKVQLIEQSVKQLETEKRPWLFLLLACLTIISWLIAIFVPLAFEQFTADYRLIPIAVILVISYFFFFTGSKFVFKPSVEELEDDTSTFALCSACGRKASRSLYSIGFSVLHTSAYVIYLTVKNPTWLEPALR